MGPLQRAIAAVRDGSSSYWALYDPGNREADRGIVEVRLNASVDGAANFTPSVGWIVERIQWDDAVFVRRVQSLKRAAVEEMLVEVLNLADANGMEFHSWLYGDDLD